MRAAVAQPCVLRVCEPVSAALTALLAPDPGDPAALHALARRVHAAATAAAFLASGAPPEQRTARQEPHSSRSWAN